MNKTLTTYLIVLTFLWQSSLFAIRVDHVTHVIQQNLYCIEKLEKHRHLASRISIHRHIDRECYIFHQSNDTSRYTTNYQAYDTTTTTPRPYPSDVSGQHALLHQRHYPVDILTLIALDTSIDTSHRTRYYLVISLSSS